MEQEKRYRVCVFLLFVGVLTQIFSLHSSSYIAKAPALLRRSTKSVCRLHRVKACPYSNTTYYPEPKDSPPPCSVLRAQVAYTKTHTKFIRFTQVFALTTDFFCLFSCLTVTAVYDVTLNFKDNQTPTLLGIVNGKKYKADMCVRWVSLTASIYFWIITYCNNDALHSTEFISVKDD